MKNGGVGLITHPPLYFIDNIDISSFCKPTFFKRAAELYESGQSLQQVAQQLDQPKSTVRKTLLDRGIALRPHPKNQKGNVSGTIPYGFVRIGGELIPDTKEQRIIQLMKNYWQSGNGFMEIARTLNNQKLMPRMARKWDGGTIRKIIARHLKIE